MPTISVTAYAVVLQPVTVTPTQVSLPAGPLTSSMTMAISIRNSGKNPLVLSDAKVNIPGAAVLLFGFSTDALTKSVPNRVGQCVTLCSR